MLTFIPVTSPPKRASEYPPGARLILMDCGSAVFHMHKVGDELIRLKDGVTANLRNGHVFWDGSLCDVHFTVRPKGDESVTPKRAREFEGGEFMQLVANNWLRKYPGHGEPGDVWYRMGSEARNLRTRSGFSLESNCDNELRFVPFVGQITVS
jgi:hypothetical protein